MCRIYHCRASGGKCCAECDDRTCANRCLNHPDRCRCAVDGEPRKWGQRGAVVDVDRILMLGRTTAMTYGEIAAEVGCSVSTVQNYLNREGIRRYRGRREHGG